MSPPIPVDVRARCFIYNRLPRRWFSSRYSGEPADYLDRFRHAIDTYDTAWPRTSRNWVKQRMTEAGGDFNAGLTVITTELVDDMGDFQGTKGLADPDREAIVDFLLANETYNKAAHRQWDKLVHEIKTNFAASAADNNDDRAVSAKALSLGGSKRKQCVTESIEMRSLMKKQTYSFTRTCLR